LALIASGVGRAIMVEDILDPDTFWKEELVKAGTDRIFACGIHRDSPG
jgi:hypothetical protein